MLSPSLTYALRAFACAPRKRHWQQLMVVTGQEFDMDPKTFTLGSMFNMQLHNHADEINKICNAAVGGVPGHVFRSCPY